MTFSSIDQCESMLFISLQTSVHRLGANKRVLGEGKPSNGPQFSCLMQNRRELVVEKHIFLCHKLLTKNVSGKRKHKTLMAITYLSSMNQQQLLKHAGGSRSPRSQATTYHSRTCIGKVSPWHSGLQSSAAPRIQHYNYKTCFTQALTEVTWKKL